MRNDMYNIGNASEVGKREGESINVPVVEDLESSISKPVSFLRKSGKFSTDIHMKIITQHRQEQIRKEIEQVILNKFIRINQEKRAEKSIFLMIIYKLKQCFQKPYGRYVNKTMIDDYVDEYWTFNCPDNYSVPKINE